MMPPGHYPRKPLLERLLAKVQKTDGCWLWTGAKYPNGYGLIGDHGRSRQTHRVAYELLVAPIPPGIGWHGTVVRHRCDIKHCVNPDHLELGSQADNIQDAVVRERMSRGPEHGQRVKQGCRRGEANVLAKLSEEQAREILAHKGKRRAVDTAVEYGVSRSLVYGIWAHTIWAHLCA